MTCYSFREQTKRSGYETGTSAWARADTGETSQSFDLQEKHAREMVRTAMKKGRVPFGRETIPLHTR
jgi:hypothetical protein